jgi:hypothetical protein
MHVSEILSEFHYLNTEAGGLAKSNRRYNHDMRCLILAAVALLTVPSILACDFKYDPASATQYYRSEGWNLPGTKDYNPSARPNLYGLPAPSVLIPGARAQILSHDESPYLVELPAQTFLLNGTKQKMRAAQFRASILRWMMGDRIVAYSYGLSPLVAHRDAGRWVIESEAACIFNVTYIDDKGDGIFRTMVHGTLSADLIPSWARIQKD